MSLRIIFAGTAEFSAPSLKQLLLSHHEVVAVLTQPDRPAGRGRKIQPGLIKQIALNDQLPVLQPISLKKRAILQQLKLLLPDIIVVVAYGLLIPEQVLKLPRFGCINIHPSLLPKWRGAAPIQRAIFAGDTLTGISIMQMETGLDTGPILKQEIVPLNSEINSKELHEQLSFSGAELLLATLNEVEQCHINPSPQNNLEASYAHKIKKEEAKINWSTPGIQIHNQIRAFNPWPVAYTLFQDQILRIWRSEFIPETANVEPGTITQAGPQGILVGTGSGQLRLLLLQSPGGKIISAQDFINSHRNNLQPGKTIFDL